MFFFLEAKFFLQKKKTCYFFKNTKVFFRIASLGRAQYNPPTKLQDFPFMLATAESTVLEVFYFQWDIAIQYRNINELGFEVA